ncbi:hypothetical protein GGS23DRAFT_617875 [Durotheca rogersii]|uniref:uncharacterized protein n=1 Tax=Durotheca rogersii TaxID=419775 RepID=UPI00221FF566|nr:uncharacterized protein GGS23DRAFT_617875 [Durotheca rogersii]KAI5856176.1 hypothetical protein GGS23DRAFT_617875 [Durotheca rogersii]
MLSHRQLVERPASPPRRQRACAPCTKAKARCHFEDNKLDGGCDRCRRLEIPCAPQTTKSLRKPRQVKPTSTPVAQQPDSHRPPGARTTNYGHALLSAGPFGVAESGPSTESNTSSPGSAARDRLSQNAHNATSSPHNSSSHESHKPTALPPPNPPPNPQPLLSTLTPLLPIPPSEPPQPGFGLTWLQADQAVFDYKIKYTPYFPFVMLDRDVSAQEVLAKKPLLFMAIMLLAAQIPLVRQKEIKKSILAHVGHNMMVAEERDLDLLQGLMVYIAWGEEDFYMDQKNTYLIYLAMGYAHNLAITRPYPTPKQKLTIAVHPKDIKEAMVGHTLTTVLEENHTAEEQRAFLGCHYLLSVNSSQFNREGMLKGDYVERCLHSLVRPTDFGTDFILDRMVRFQRIVEEITEKLPIPKIGESAQVFTLAMSNTMQLLRVQLDQLLANITREHRQFLPLWAMHNYVLVRLYLLASYSSQPSDEVLAQHQRQCMLYCLQAARSFFSASLATGPESFYQRSFSSFAEILFVLVAASRLLLVEIDLWDLASARQTLDLPATIDEIIACLETAVDLHGQELVEAAARSGGAWALDGSGDMRSGTFCKYIVKLQWIKNWFESQLSLGARGGGDEPHVTSGTNNWQPESAAWNPFLVGYMADTDWGIDF